MRGVDVCVPEDSSSCVCLFFSGSGKYRVSDREALPIILVVIVVCAGEAVP